MEVETVIQQSESDRHLFEVNKGQVDAEKQKLNTEKHKFNTEKVKFAEEKQQVETEKKQVEEENKGRNGTSHGHPVSYFLPIPAHSSNLELFVFV